MDESLTHANLSVMDDTTAQVLARIPDGTLIDRMQIEVSHVSATKAIGSMPVAGNEQVRGLLHGGASAVLAETLGSLAAGVHGFPEKHAVGVELSISHHKAVAEGRVLGTATAVHLGRTLASFEIEIVDENGRRISSARLTCALIDAD